MQRIKREKRDNFIKDKNQTFVPEVGQFYEVGK
jgi:hypothetical protein